MAINHVAQSQFRLGKFHSAEINQKTFGVVLIRVSRNSLTLTSALKGTSVKIAIIGSGISSLTAAYLLSNLHDIQVFEADNRIGGHTATKHIEFAGESHAIDTGFIVYNDWTYPNFIRLMTTLGVPSRAAEMSYSVTDELSGLEYSGTNLNTLFSQRRNLISPTFWRMLRDIMRFNREALLDWRAGKIPAAMSLATYLTENHYGHRFIHQYLIPMGAAIWSSGDQIMLDFPAEFFIRFFNNHGLLSVNNRPQWRTLVGGSQAYLKPLTKHFAEKIQLNSRITAIYRREQGVEIHFENDEQQHFDQVVIGTHSDQALKLLGDANHNERTILGAIP
jgi:predicted NAD/FAD-binding protein